MKICFQRNSKSMFLYCYSQSVFHFSIYHKSRAFRKHKDERSRMSSHEYIIHQSQVRHGRREYMNDRWCELSTEPNRTGYTGYPLCAYASPFSTPAFFFAVIYFSFIADALQLVYFCVRIKMTFNGGCSCNWAPIQSAPPLVFSNILATTIICFLQPLEYIFHKQLMPYAASLI